MKKYNTRAIVLKSLNYKDTDKIYTLLSEDYGKINAIARGVRRIKSRRGGNLDTLNLISAKITEGSNGFKSIDEVDTLNSFPKIKKVYEKTAKAFYIVELIHKSIEEDESLEKIFPLVENTLVKLDSSNYSSVSLVANFELHLLKYLGYQVNLSKLKNLNEGLYNTIMSLSEGKLSELDPKSVDRADVFIKSYIYEYLADKFKSLEMVL